MRKECLKVIAEDSLCSGCGLCRNLCVKNAITMQIDANGFSYPIIDSELCVECGLCHSMCPALLPPMDDNEAEMPKMFAVKSKDNTIHEAASSGGAFILLSDLILQTGGTVYCCSFDDEWTAIHIRAETYDERDRMCGSKYVQSDVGETYTLVGQDLKNGKTVLFTGTPCQVDALHKYLAVRRINEEELITVDLICHGVPNPKTWREHLEKLKSRYKAKPRAVSFRKKDKLGNAQAL